MNGRRAPRAAEVEPNYVPVEWQLVKQKADNVVANRLKNKIATQTHVPRVLYNILYINKITKYFNAYIEIKNFVTFIFIFVSVVCTCATPRNGTRYSQNKMHCSDGLIKYCSPVEECYSYEPFEYGKLDDGCRLPPPPPGNSFVLEA